MPGRFGRPKPVAGDRRTAVQRIAERSAFGWRDTVAGVGRGAQTGYAAFPHSSASRARAGRGDAQHHDAALLGGAVHRARARRRELVGAPPGAAHGSQARGLGDARPGGVPAQRNRAPISGAHKTVSMFAVIFGSWRKTPTLNPHLVNFARWGGHRDRAASAECARTPASARHTSPKCSNCPCDSALFRFEAKSGTRGALTPLAVDAVGCGSKVSFRRPV